MTTLVSRSCHFPSVTLQQVHARNAALIDMAIVKNLLFFSRDKSEIIRFIGPGKYWEEQFILSTSPTVNGNGSATLDPEDIILIGRSRKADLWLNDKSVSRMHCRVRMDSCGRLDVLDLGSLNGTRIDGELIPAFKPVLMRGDQALQIGTHCLTFTKRIGCTEPKYVFEMMGNPVFCSRCTYQSDAVGFEFKDKKNNGSLKVWIDRLAIVSLVGCYYGLTQIPLLPPDSMELIAELLMDVYCCSIRDKLHTAGFDGLDVTRLGQSEQPEQDLLKAEVQMKTSDDSWSGCFPVWFDFSSCSSMMEHLGNMMGRWIPKGIVDYDSLKILVFCSLFNSSIRDSDWLQLKPGDVILLGIQSVGIDEAKQTEQNIVLRIGADDDTFPGFIGYVRVLAGNLSFELISDLNNGGDTVQTVDRVACESNYASSICETRLVNVQDEQFIPIKVEIGSQAVSLKDLMLLQPGMIINLKQRIGDLLLVKSGDQIIARGRLMDIEGEFGIELIEIVRVIR